MSGTYNGHVNMLFDESINRYYLAGKRGDYATLVDFSFNGVPILKQAFLISFTLSSNTITEVWRKEINTNQTTMDDEIHSIIKDANSSDIFISGRYYSDTVTPVTFGNYTFPIVSYNIQRPFVMKINSSGVVQWSKIRTVFQLK